jgi:antibiotic biosynthesis monooxygenase (ABM) superfamily enzyme
MYIETTGASSEPVTIVVSRDLLPGREPEYHAWAHRMIAAAERFPGSLGVTVLVPGAEAPGRRTLIHRWADEQALRAWEGSDATRRLLKEANAFSIRHRQRATGLETWFTLPDAPVQAPPPRWKMYLVTLLTVYALSVVIVPGLASWLGRFPYLARQAVITVVLTTLLTFVLLPLLTHVLRVWLYPTSSAEAATPIAQPRAGTEH